MLKQAMHSHRIIVQHSWKIIEDIKSSALLAVAELDALAQVRQEQRERLGTREAYRQFVERLKREWAIETGLMERLYTLDRGITELLIDHGINAALIPHERGVNPEAIVAMISDHEAAVDGVFDFVKSERRLSTSYIKQMHALMTRHQDTVEGVDPLGNKISVPLRRGAWKQHTNNPRRSDGTVHEYCPPEHVDSEMDRLIEMHDQHGDLAPEVEAAWLHHRFAQIHPFEDGNGRIARTLATLVFVKAGWFPLVVRDRERAMYLDALETADGGDLKPLVEYFARLQRDQFVRALHIAEDVQQSRRVTETITSVRRQMQRRRDSLVAEWETAKSVASELWQRAQHRLEEVAKELKLEMSVIFDHNNYFTSGAEDGDSRSHYYRHQIIEAAKQLDYFANPQIYRSWTRIKLENTNSTEMLISFHGIGREFQGVLACSASWFQRVETDEGERESGPVTAISESVFLINYKEPLAEATERFSDWLERALVRGLKLWQETAL